MHREHLALLEKKNKDKRQKKALPWSVYLPLPVYLGCHIHTLLLIIRYWGTSGLGQAKGENGPPFPPHTYL